MKMMIATKRMRYGTRRLVAGEEFECEPRHAKLLVTLKRATPFERAPAVIPPIPEKLKERAVARQEQATPAIVQPEADERADLRTAYETKFGKRPYYGWSADELRRRIASAE